MSAALKLVAVAVDDDQARAGLRRDGAIVAGVAAATTVYATLRYNVFKGVPWDDWPGYVVNKVLAVSSLVLLAWAGWRKLRATTPSTTLMTWGGAAALGHVLLSLTLFQPRYFEKLFVGVELTFAGGLSMTTAALAFALLEVGARRSARWAPDTALAALMLLLVLGAVHTAVPAAASWVVPSSWPGHLPPLTLLACAPACIVIGTWLLRFLGQGSGRSHWR